MKIVDIQRDHRPLMSYNAGDTSREAFYELIKQRKIANQEMQYLELLLNHPNGLTDSEASHLLNWPKSERAGARRKGVMNKHEKAFINKYGEEYYKEYFWHLIIKNGRKSNLRTGMSNTVWMINHDYDKKIRDEAI